MKWVEALEAALEAVASDPALVATLGGARLYRAGSSRELQVPSIEYLIVSDVQDENTQRLRTQWDIFAGDLSSAITVEERLRAILHSNLPLEIGGVRMWAQLLDARDMPDPEPGVVHRLLDFLFEPVREN